MQFGSAGAGAATFGCVVLNMTIDANVTHDALSRHRTGHAGLVGGRIDYLCEAISTAEAADRSGRRQGARDPTKDRSPVLPDLRTAIEQGTNVQAYAWYGVFLPGYADAIVKRLNTAATEAVKHTRDRCRSWASGGRTTA